MKYIWSKFSSFLPPWIAKNYLWKKSNGYISINIYILIGSNLYERRIYFGDYTSKGFNDIFIYEIITKLMIHEDIFFLAGNHDVQKYYLPNLNAEMSSWKIDSSLIYDALKNRVKLEKKSSNVSFSSVKN